jgi:hypothetical protein
MPILQSLCSSRGHHLVFDIHFILGQAIWKKFKRGSSDIATSFKWHSKYTLNLSLFLVMFSMFFILIICFNFIFCLMSIVLEKFQLFIFVCNGFQSLFTHCMKAFVVLIGSKSCCRLSSLFREAKDVVVYLILCLKD